MSDDYLSRLRAELLRAGAAQAPRRRRPLPAIRLGPVVAVAAVALLVAAIVLTVPGERRDDLPSQVSGGSVRLTYRVQSGDPTAAAQIMRARLKHAGVAAELTVGDRTLAITAPRAVSQAVNTLTVPGRFAIYDWERSVLGPDGRPAPRDPAVTGGPGAGQLAALTEEEARARAAKRAGALAVHADHGWFTLGGDAPLTNADLSSVRAGEDPMGGNPVVQLDLTSAGQQAFTTLTRELAERGADHSGGGDPLQTSQHFALVLDDRLLSTPFINWREVPEGIDGSEGVYIPDLPTPERARLTAALLSAGPLAASLQPVSG
ncbi:hypothetical protein OJ998_15525 [Solirubrobacter taibaiensis]|nr:hypothetical protein [Solirubrobacter taibaiensis]